MAKHRHETEHQSFGKPEDARKFPNGRAKIVKTGGTEVGRLVLKPGCCQANDVRPIAKNG